MPCRVAGAGGSYSSGPRYADCGAMTLNGGSGTLEVSGFGTRWGKAVLMPSIADVAGSAVPYSYGAAVQ
jgi:hypothetical protein